MSLANASDLQDAIVAGCQRIENAWVASTEQKRIAHASRLYWWDPSNLPELNKLFVLYQQTARGEKAIVLDVATLTTFVEVLFSWLDKEFHSFPFLGGPLATIKAFVESEVATIAVYLTSLGLTSGRQLVKALFAWIETKFAHQASILMALEFLSYVAQFAVELIPL